MAVHKLLVGIKSTVQNILQYSHYSVLKIMIRDKRHENTTEKRSIPGPKMHTYELGRCRGEYSSDLLSSTPCQLSERKSKTLLPLKIMSNASRNVMLLNAKAIYLVNKFLQREHFSGLRMRSTPSPQRQGHRRKTDLLSAQGVWLTCNTNCSESLSGIGILVYGKRLSTRQHHGSI